MLAISDLGLRSELPLSFSKNPNSYNRRNVVATFWPLFLIGSSLFLQITRTYIKTWMNSDIGQTQQLTTELAATEQLKSMCPLFLSCF